MNRTINQLQTIIDGLREQKNIHFVTMLNWQSGIPAQLKQLRESTGLTLTQLHEASGVSRSYLHQVESGESEPTIGMLNKVLAVYGLKLAIVPIE